MVPVLEYRIEGRTLSYRWTDVVPGFDMPVDVTLDGERSTRLWPTTSWQTMEGADAAAFRVDPDFYVIPRDVAAQGGGTSTRGG